MLPWVATHVMRGLSGCFCGCSQGLEHVESWAIEDCSRPKADNGGNEKQSFNVRVHPRKRAKLAVARQLQRTVRHLGRATRL